MKYVKTFGLAAMAAMALMAFVASSASATAVYSGETKLGVGTVIDASLTGSAILESGSTVLDTCTEGTVKGEITNAGGSTSTVSGTNTYKEGEVVKQGLTWGGCSKTTDTLNSGTLEIHWIEGTNNGTLTASEAEVTINTIFGTCVYGSAKALDLGTLVGSTTGNATMSISTSVPKISGNFACPSTSLWTASYAVTSPSPLHVTAS